MGASPSFPRSDKHQTRQQGGHLTADEAEHPCQCLPRQTGQVTPPNPKPHVAVLPLLVLLTRDGEGCSPESP